MLSDAKTPVLIIGAGARGLTAALRAADLGFQPIILDQRPCAPWPGDCAMPATPITPKSAEAADHLRLAAALQAADPLFLWGRRAMAVWGALETGFNVETDTGETVTAAAVIFAGDQDDLTGLDASVTLATGETALPGLFIARTEAAATLAAEAAAIRIDGVTPNQPQAGASHGARRPLTTQATAT